VKIFISYGHDFSQEAFMLAESLRSVGHDVWIDTERIVAGNDWRDRITEGILQSDYVLALLSVYGLREGGVCRDELAIALSCNRRNIRPVKMESGIEPLVPPAISGIQFFDMSEWRNIAEDKFDEWYKAKLTALIKTCFARSVGYERKLQSIKNRLHYFPKFSREMFELGKDFKRREWLDERINEWLNGNNGNVCLLVGFPGFGKSCYCANYYHYSDEVAGIVFCVKNKTSQYGIAEVIREVSFQFAVRIPSFATRLDHVLSDFTFSIDTLSNEELFDRLIVEPLNLIDGKSERIVIILDGIGVFSDKGENELALLFYEKSNLFPPYVKFLLTTRRDSSVLSGKLDINRINIDPNDIQVYDDIKDYVSQAAVGKGLDSEDAYDIGDKVAKLAQGSFLYASVIGDGLKSGSIKPEDIGVLPRKIADMYFSWFRQIVSPEEYSEKYVTAISLLAAFENPPLDFIQNVLGWKKSELQAFLHKFSSVFIRNVDKFGNVCISFYSDSFMEWIKDEELASTYTAYEEDGYISAAEYLSEAYEDEELTDYDYINAVSILKNGKKKKFLAIIAEDDDFFEASFKLVEKLQKDPEYYNEWITILNGLSYLCGKREDAKKFECRIAYLEAKGEFICGDLFKCGKILKEKNESMEKYGRECDYFDSLYMLGTVCDYCGERDRSVEIFQKLAVLSDCKSPEHYVKALAGLIWNDHFNNLEEGIARLKKLETVDIDRDLLDLKNLITARMLLSAGKVDEAVLLFGKVLSAEDSGIWEYNITARKNQMLAIEAIVAAYDAGKPALAVEYGEKIYSKLKGNGSISECYCLSWLSLAYYKSKQQDKAVEYLEKAKSVLNANEGTSSLWLNMHLTSIDAKYLQLQGDMARSVELYKKVEEYAEKCSDLWVRGDACFEIISVGFYNDLDTDIDEKYKATLYELANESQLPHLLYKAEIVRLIKADDEQAIKKICDFENIPSLPGVNPVTISRLLLKKARAVKSESAKIFEKYLKEIS
jgi:hypothetical protein